MGDTCPIKGKLLKDYHEINALIGAMVPARMNTENFQTKLIKRDYIKKLLESFEGHRD